MDNRQNQFEVLDSYIGLGDVLIRASKSEPNVIFIEASNMAEDTQKDVVLQKALKEEANNFIKKGVISYDHLHKAEKNPKYIIGEPLEVKFPDDGRTLVKGRIYPSNEYGKAVLQLAKDGSTRLGGSVGGAILKRAIMHVDSLNKSVRAIVKVLWDEVAVTYQPINEKTLGNVSYLPFAEFKKSFIFDDTEREDLLQKAMQAGYGTDSSQFTGGRALVPESLMGDTKKNKKKLVDAFALVISNIKSGNIKSFSHLVPVLAEKGLKSYSFIVAKTIAGRIDKVSEMMNKSQGG
jgi:hypothetical protein